MPRRRLLAVAVAFAAVAGLAVSFLQVPRAPSGEQPHEVTVRVIGHRWSWEFFVTDERGRATHTIGELTVRVGSVVKLFVTSADLVYSLYVPELSLKVDAIPGLETTLTFIPSQIGDLTIRNAEFAGPEGYRMVATLHVVPA